MSLEDSKEDEEDGVISHMVLQTSKMDFGRCRDNETKRHSSELSSLLEAK